MAYGLYTAVYDITLAGKSVLITDAFTGVPATIMQSPSGGVVNSTGLTTLDSLGRMSVIIDLAKQWTFNVVNGRTIGYDVSNSPQLISMGELQTLVPSAGVTYVLDQAPYTRYNWDGVNLVSSLSATEILDVQTSADVKISGVSFDTSDRLLTYNRNGVDHTVTYPDPNTIVITNSTGQNKVIVINDQGQVVSIQ